jgi:hypothetical protein
MVVYCKLARIAGAIIMTVQWMSWAHPASAQGLMPKLPISLPCAECKQIHLTLGFWDRISISVDRCSCASSSDRLKVASIFLASSASAICPSRSSFATRASWRAT